MVVIVIISFIYYFRKRAWAMSLDMHNKLRDLPWSPAREESFLTVIVRKSYPLSLILMKMLVDLTSRKKWSAMALQDHVDVDFDDDMLIPELAKHVQAHMMTLLNVLIEQGDVKGLQETLTKEIDDLKLQLLLHPNDKCRRQRKC